ncbi:hypothetical protein [Klebsiella phage vB_KvaP_F5M1D]|nr:hypothetical protein [Klebsiella phage vB_KvaP_F4M1D]UNA05431.1 hypothetical protein [Klebsiella phage vB_KvaP_F5M1D]
MITSCLTRWTTSHTGSNTQGLPGYPERHS